MSGGGEIGVAAIRPVPTDEEVAAILAAVEVAWPRPPAPATPAPDSSAWRFSGRSWARPLTARRDRPWLVTRP